ncbi:hypothetical protein OH807_16475 [Kitasatospora sp. NBC_01560]|uniref:hypothetical protein n=1 Tax=Kitasatospora sp. NBC_01560 TaxID=2975965 RepID=UPI003865B674
MDTSNRIENGTFQNVVMAGHAHVTLGAGALAAAGAPAEAPDLPELPPLPAGFTGREAEPATLLPLLDPDAERAADA